MPIRVQLPDGNIGEFPDSMPHDQIEAVLAKQFPKSSSTPANALKPEARTFGNYAGEVASGVGRGLVNDVTGIAQTVAHPIDTAKGLAKQGVQAARAAGQEYKDNADAPTGQRLAATALRGLEEAPIVGGMVQHAEKGGTQLASPEAAGAAAEGITSFAAPELIGKGVGGILKRTGKALTGTGTGPTEALVEKTKEANTKAVEGAAEKNAVQQAKAKDSAAAQADQRKVDLKKHFEKTSETKAANTAKDGQVSRREALNRGVDTLSDKFQTDLKTTRDKAATEANAKYTTLNKALGSKVIRSEHLLGHLLDASEKFKGSMTEPAIFKDIEKAVKSSDVISYDDLQGYYSEIGRELQKGSLPGDVYTAYNTLHEAIGGEMQKVADANKMGPQLAEARTSWRNLKQTFYDPTKPLTKALKSTEPGAAIRALAGKDRAGIEALAKYNPDLARSANTVRGYQSEAASLPKQAKGLKSLPKLAEKPAPEAAPTPIEPVKKTIGTEDIREAKRKGLQQSAHKVVKGGTWIATWPLIYAIKDIMHGQMPSIAGMAVDSAGTVAAVHGIADIMKNPKVVEFLTKATPADVEVIPPDLRGDLSGIIKEAQKSGIHVSPALLKAAASRGTVAAALTGSKPRFDVETGTQ
jgi:hypothetical protein